MLFGSVKIHKMELTKKQKAVKIKEKYVSYNSKLGVDYTSILNWN